MPINQNYIGQELAIFAQATNWKQYYTSIIRPYLSKRVIEVGAGIGATTLVMCDGEQEEWICLEPDAELRNYIGRLILEKKLPACCRTRAGFVSDLEPSSSFDTFIYIDVLEHIEEDYTELEIASAHLTPGGRIIVLSPAFNFLYSPFDKSIGHIRRYDKKMFQALTPKGFKIEKLIYLDLVGMATALINRFVLHQPLPTIKQILLWDQRMIPITKWIDRFTGYQGGRSLLGIWRKDGT